MTDGNLNCKDCNIVFVVTEDTDLDYPRCKECEDKAMRELIEEQRHPDQPTGMA